MKVTYTGRQEPLTPAQKRKLDAKLAKLGKLLDRKDSECEAHAIVTAERHLKRVEITVNVYDHPIVGVAASADFYTALCDAVDRLEKQVLKLRTKKRDTKREVKPAWKTGAAVPAAVSSILAPDRRPCCAPGNPARRDRAEPCSCRTGWHR